jgi:hypothetical protein
MRPKQHRGLSTAFGWRLTPLKMTENSELVAEKAVTANSFAFDSFAFDSFAFDSFDSFVSCVDPFVTSRFQGDYFAFRISLIKSGLLSSRTRRGYFSPSW